jgi:hypothetical protein
MPIKTRKYRKGKMKGGWPWSKKVRVAPAPPPRREVDATNEQYANATEIISFCIRALDTPFSLSGSTLRLTYALQFIFLHEIWNISEFTPESKEAYVDKLRRSVERRALFARLGTYIDDFTRVFENQDAYTIYKEGYNRNDYYSSFLKMMPVFLVYDTFDSRVYTGNVYLNMGRLKEIYKYCNDVDRMTILAERGEFYQNTTSFLHYGSIIPPSTETLHRVLYDYVLRPGEQKTRAAIRASARQRDADALSLVLDGKLKKCGYGSGISATMREITKEQEFETTLGRVLAAALERADAVVSGDVRLEPSDEEVVSLREVYRLANDMMNVRFSRPAAKRPEGGSLSKSFKTSTNPAGLAVQKAIITRQTLW